MDLHFEVLTKEQKKLLSKLKFLKKQGFYLGGGTALALQIGHRTSIDFDFYRKTNFRPGLLYEKISKYVEDIQRKQVAFGTLILKAQNVDISLFYYDYPFVFPLIDVGDAFLLSLGDIAAMKLEAIIQRGIKRDFVDIYFLLKLFGIKKLFDLTKKKYQKAFNVYQALLGLLYFQDAEAERQQKRYRFIQKIDWEDVKKEISRQVEKFKREELLR